MTPLILFRPPKFSLRTLLSTIRRFLSLTTLPRCELSPEPLWERLRPRFFLTPAAPSLPSRDPSGRNFRPQSALTLSCTWNRPIAPSSLLAGYSRNSRSRLGHAPSTSRFKSPKIFPVTYSLDDPSSCSPVQLPKTFRTAAKSWFSATPTRAAKSGLPPRNAPGHPPNAQEFRRVFEHRGSCLYLSAPRSG